MISQFLASIGEVTEREIQEIWDNLVSRYGASQKIASELMDQVDSFPLVRGPDQGEQLRKLHDLCRALLYNLP